MCSYNLLYLAKAISDERKETGRQLPNLGLPALVFHFTLKPDWQRANGISRLEPNLPLLWAFKLIALPLPVSNPSGPTKKFSIHELSYISQREGECFLPYNLHPAHSFTFASSLWTFFRDTEFVFESPQWSWSPFIRLVVKWWNLVIFMLIFQTSVRLQ